MLGHDLGVTLGVLMVTIGEGGLRDQGPEPGVVGLGGQLQQLLVGDGQLLTELPEAHGHLGQSALDEGSGHSASVRAPGGGSRRRLVPVRRSPTVALLASLVVLAPLLVGCGDDGGTDSACGPVTREALDPQFLVHVLGDADVEYTSDPPTSGPHQPTPQASGVLTDPLDRPLQVGILERGDVLLQYRTGLPADERAALEALGGPGVVVAPNDDLDHPVVATAWLHRRNCSSVDVGSLQAFVDERRGRGPGSETDAGH